MAKAGRVGILKFPIFDGRVAILCCMETLQKPSCDQ